MLTTLLFASEIKFVLKIEGIYGLFIIKKNREALNVLCSVVEHLGSD